MTIDYNKLVQMLLPSFLRQVKLVALIRVLVDPIRRLNEELSEWFEWRRIRMAATPQAKWIEYIIRREAGLTISIREGSHLPWDFIVGISIDETNIDQVDAKRKAESLINRYKQAGRRWIFDNEMLIPSVRFDGFVCQLEEQMARFTGFVCEIEKGVNGIYISDGWIWSQYPVDVRVQIKMHIDTAGNGIPQDLYYIEEGSTRSDSPLYSGYFVDMFVEEISWEGESEWNYTY